MMNIRKHTLLTLIITSLLSLPNSAFPLSSPYGGSPEGEGGREVGGVSPYITKVFDFQPAPGQFVNELPLYEEGFTKQDMILAAEECIQGEEKILVSLGGYGGYIVFGFDHMIPNVPGEYDFKIWGNAFYADANPNPEAPREGGSCEPGIVMVSYDANGNGIPDDAWYELAGSEYYKPETIKNYRLTYYKPDENKVRTPDNDYPFLNDTTYVRWTSNQGDYGYVSRNIFHSQSYYPQWITDETLVFEGTKLADNYVDESGTGSYYVQYAYGYGYVDNHPNLSEKSNMNIEWAVDSEGNPVSLGGIHFVKVYTGVNQYCGWLGETSTEISGAEELHMTQSGLYASNIVRDNIRVIGSTTNTLTLFANETTTISIYHLSGIKLIERELQAGTNRLDTSRFPSGVYIIKSETATVKFIK